jgi:hypothetical protein
MHFLAVIGALTRRWLVGAGRVVTLSTYTGSVKGIYGQSSRVRGRGRSISAAAQYGVNTPFAETVEPADGFRHDERARTPLSNQV